MEKFPANPDEPPQILTYDDLKHWDPKKTFKGLLMEQRMNAERAVPGQVERRQQIERELGEAYQDHVRGLRYAVGRPYLDIMGRHRQFDPAVHTQREVFRGMMEAFQQVGPDLGLETEDPSDPAFQDWFRDAASDVGIPPEMVEAALKGDSGRKKAMIKRAYKKLAMTLEDAIELADEFHAYGGPTFEQLSAVVRGEDISEQNPNALRQIQRLLMEVSKIATMSGDDELLQDAQDLVEAIETHFAGGDEDEAEEPEEPPGGPGVPPTTAAVEAALDAALKQAATPPGREEQVKKLKTVPGVENPWAVAWGQYKKKHPGKKNSSINVVPGGVSLLMVERVLDAAAEEHVRQVEAAGKGKYPGGLNPPRWVPWSLREIWREAAERFIEEEGGDPAGPNAYGAVAQIYNGLMKKHAPTAPGAMSYELAKEKEPWKKQPAEPFEPSEQGLSETGPRRTASSRFAATDFPPSRAVAQQVKDQGSAMSFLDRVKAKGQAWLGEFFQKLRSEGYEDEAMLLENASQAIPLAEDEGTPGEVPPGLTAKKAAKDDGLADEIEVDGYPARVLKRLGQIAGKEAVRVEVIAGPRKGDVLTAIEG